MQQPPAARYPPPPPQDAGAVFMAELFQSLKVTLREPASTGEPPPPAAGADPSSHHHHHHHRHNTAPAPTSARSSPGAEAAQKAAASALSSAAASQSPSPRDPLSCLSAAMATHTAIPEHAVVHELMRSSDALSASACRLIEDDAGARLRRIRRQASLARRRRAARVARLDARRATLATHVAATLEGAGLRNSLYERRLAGQLDSASRRLQELLHECLGEYAKARARALERSQVVHS